MADQTVACWSGGKDSCLALYRALAEGIRVRALVNLLTHDGTRSIFQDIPASIIRLQAQSLKLRLIQISYHEHENPQNCERQSDFWLKEIRAREHARAVISGHIGTQDIQRKQMLRQCRKAGLRLIEPLSGEDPENLLDNFLRLKFEAVIVKVDSTRLAPSWLGHTIDRHFIQQLKKLKNVNLSGDLGEYHSLVLAGPLFAQRIEISELKPIRSGDTWMLQIGKSRLGAASELK